MPSWPPRFDLPPSVMIDVYRGMSPGQRVEAGLSATDLIRARLETHLRERNPRATEDDIALAVARRLLGDRG